MKTMAMQTLSTKKHRIISALLAVALLLSWLPAMALHAHAADAQTISFCPDGGSDNPGAYTLSEHQWAVDATNTSASIPARTSNWVIYPNSFWKAQFAMDEVLVLDFQVAQSGSYAVSLAGWQLDALGIVAAVSVDGFVLGNADFSHPGGSGTNENAVMELGAITLPFNPMDVIVLGMMQSSVGLTVNYVTFSVFNIFFGIVIVLLYSLAVKFIFRPDTGALAEKVDRFGHLRGQKMNGDQKIALGALLVFLAMLLLPGILPKTWPVISQLSTLSVSGSAIVVIIILMIIRDKKSDTNEGLLNWGKAAIKGVNWDVIILLASTMPISNALESDESGVMAACEQFLSSQIGDMSPMLAIAFISIALAIITQFSHNAVLLIIFVPMLCPLVESYGINPVVMAITLMFSVQSALVTPAASTQAAMIFSNTEWIDKKMVFKLALCGMIIMVAVALLGVLPAANIVY